MMKRYVKNAKTRGACRERRKFLDLVGRAGIASAILKTSPLAMSVLSSRFAEAKSGGKKHAVFMFLGDGSPPNNWLPKSATEMAFSTVPYGPTPAPGIEAHNISNYCHFHEVMNSWGSHGQTFKCMGRGDLDANRYIDTMDSQLAKHNTWTTRFPIVRVGINQQHPGFSVADGQVQTFKKGANILLSDLFGGAQVNQDDTTYKTVFEMNARALASIKNKLGQEEKIRLDKHLATLEKIEMSLSAPPASGSNAATCEAPSINGNPSDIVEHGKLVSDILIEAFKCDLASIASVMVGDDQCNWTIAPEIRPLLNLPPGTPDNYHAAMHSPQQSTDAGLGRFLSYISQVPAYFISKLVSENDSTGQPLIESSLVCQITDMGDGRDHGPADAPWILAGPAKFGLGSFANSGYNTNTQVLESIPDRMDLDGKLFG